jgi:hypothetical protein
VVRANPQIANPNLIHPGQVVTIPDTNTSNAGGLQLPQFEWPRRARSQVTTNFSNSVALEVYASLVIHRSLWSGGRFDLFNQPTGTLTLGLGLNPTAWGTPTGYVGLSLSITVLNWIMFGSREHPLFELGLGQLSFGATSNGGFSSGAGIGGEFHLNDQFSILGAGSLNLSPAPSGVTAGPQFNFGLLRHF